MKIYVASSWRNLRQPAVVAALRTAGHDVYDFRHPAQGNDGFAWDSIEPNWQSWTREQYVAALRHPAAEEGYRLDFEAMRWADAFVGVMPFGRSASMEMGWAAGAGKTTVLLLEDGEPELMVKMFTHICCSLDDAISALKAPNDVHAKPSPRHGQDCSCAWCDLGGCGTEATPPRPYRPITPEQLADIHRMIDDIKRKARR